MKDKIENYNYVYKKKKLKKLTLRTHPVSIMCLQPLTAGEIRTIRERFNMSRSVFARKLRISPRTLERWEQGVSKPNQQAEVLIMLVKQFNDMLDRISTLNSHSNCE